jgi:hypothetical protein
MIKKLLNATKDNSYSPAGTLNVMCLLDKCISNSDNSALMSRPHSGGFAEENLKAFFFVSAFQAENLFFNG